MKLKIAVIGANGRMGSRIIALAAQPPSDFEIVGRITRDNNQLGQPDVIIDFSSPDATMRYLQIATERRIPMLIGTTGLSAEHHAAIERAARVIPILPTTNTSIGVAILNRIVADLSNLLPDAEIEIIETHHVHKKDAPSGTAISLRDSAARDVPIRSIRQSEEIGTHQVNFALPDERIELTHRALDRDVFARGALTAATWLARQKPGRYTMNNALTVSDRKTGDCP